MAMVPCPKIGPYVPNPPELSGSVAGAVVAAVAVAAFVAVVVDVDGAAAACVPVSDRFPVVSCAATATVDVENVADAEAETGAETELEA